MRSSAGLLNRDDPTSGAGMDINELDVAVCRSILAGNELGRVVYTYRAMPAAVSVHYLNLGTRILLSLPRNSELVAELSGQIVALLVEDDHEHQRRSVLLTGLCLPSGAAAHGTAADETSYLELHSPLLRGRRHRLR